MTALTSALIASIQREPREIQFEDRTFTLRASNAAGRLYRAELELVDSAGVVVGYITPYGDNEHGAVKDQYFDVGLPRLFRSLEDAVAEILN